jgi:hypothetical protein
MDTRKENRINEILNSLDGCTQATAPDFFYTRLKARMENDAAPAARTSWMLRPAYAFAGMAIILLINVLAVFNQPGTEENTAATEVDTFQSLASEYRLNEGNSSISMYNLNQDK